MKKLLKIITALFAASSLLTGCLLNVNESEGKTNDATSSITINITNAAARTALPEVVWSNYVYTFTAYKDYVSETNPGTEIECFETPVVFSKIENKVFPMSPANYKFILRGYTDTTKTTEVIEGSAVADISTGHKDVLFVMYPVKGGKGNSSVTVTFPNDGIVSKVVAAWSTNPIAEADDSSLKNKTELSITATSSGDTATYTLTDLDSATKQYAVFYFYDSDGQIICTFAESLYIVTGLTSTSSLTLTADDYHRYTVSVSVKRDGSLWASSGKIIKLVSKDNSSISYTLTENKGTYSGSVTEGTYYIYDDETNTGIEFDSTEKTTSLNYYTVSFDLCKGVNVNVTSGTQLTDKKWLVLEGESLAYTINFTAGYGPDDDFTVLQGTTTAGNSSTYNKITSSSAIFATTTITITGSKAIPYGISYSKASDETWSSGYPSAAPKEYTVENYDTIILPDLSCIKKTGKVLDGWKISGTDDSTAFARIPAGTTGDLNLVAVWKDSVYVDTTNKKIYARGISLIIQRNSSNSSITEIYVDFDSDGVIDSDDYQVTDASDYSGYSLYACNPDGTLPASDFTFTMKGGNIAAMVGLGAEKANKSTVNISGYSVIGNGTTTGIDLTSITNEWVNIVGEMSGDYSITLETQYTFDRNASTHIVAYIDDSSYAQLSKFKCIYNGDDSEQTLGLKNVTSNSVTKTIIYLADPDPISVPGDSGVIWQTESDGSTSTTDFTLGETTKVTIPCSVFSISVTGGTFELQQTAMTNGDGTTITTENLGQTGTTTYESELHTETSYIYMHMFSHSNQITSDTATDFLRSIIFKKDDEDTEIQIKINLETVPYSQIEAMGSKFSYYDGSFYLGVSSGSSIDWVTAYNAAKNTVFNGLNGYLINITSEVENGYIFAQMGLGLCWTGGARFEAGSSYNSELTTYDNSTWPMSSIPGKTYVTKFIWQSGPEAGQWYQDGTIPSGSAGQKKYSKGSSNGYTNWQSGEPNDSYSVSTGNFWNRSTTYYSEQCMHFRADGTWNDFIYNNSEVTGYIVEFSPYTTTYSTQKANYTSTKRTVSY